MNGTRDVRDLFKDALGEGHGRNFMRGTTANDARKFFAYVAAQHKIKDGTTVRFAFKKCGGNKKWSVALLMKQLSRSGKYVFFGATRKNNGAHNKQLKQMRSQKEDEAKIIAWDKAQALLSDHAVSVVVNVNSEGKIFDNGCTSGEKVYSVQNVAERMRSLNDCFYVDLFVVSNESVV